MPIASASKEASPLLCAIDAPVTAPPGSSCTRIAAVPETSSARTAGEISGGGGGETTAAGASATTQRAPGDGCGVALGAAVAGDPVAGAAGSEARGRACAMTCGTARCGGRRGALGAGVRRTIVVRRNAVTRSCGANTGRGGWNNVATMV